MLLWRLDQQGSAATSAFAKSAKAIGRVLSGPIVKEPFFDLDTERSHAMGWKRIPWTSIAQYALFYELDEDQTESLIMFIQSMDQAHIARLEKIRQAEAAKDKK